MQKAKFWDLVQPLCWVVSIPVLPGCSEVPNIAKPVQLASGLSWDLLAGSQVGWFDTHRVETGEAKSFSTELFSAKFGFLHQRLNLGYGCSSFCFQNRYFSLG